jgi:hypothetical protein
MDIVHITLLTLSYYVTTVDNFGNFEAIQGAPWYVFPAFLSFSRYLMLHRSLQVRVSISQYSIVS